MAIKSISAYSQPHGFANSGRVRTFSHLLLTGLSAAVLITMSERIDGVQRTDPVELSLPQPATSNIEVVAEDSLPQAVTPADTAPPPVSENVRISGKRIEALAGFLAKKYRISQATTRDLIRTAYTEGRRVGIDPLLIIAVMAVESSFNPIAESVAGAKGLMQVIPRYHAEKFGRADEEAVLDPETNIQVGAQILKEYIQRAGGLEAGLQLYNGAPADEKNTYAVKVLGEKQRLQWVIGRVRTDA